MHKVLITGATGFVGQHLMSVLPQDRTRVTLRHTDSIVPLGCESVTVGDINQHTDWSVALNDVECVVHLAGVVHVMKPTAKDERRFYEVNVLGTERLAAAAANHGVKRFVFLSSVKVNGEATFDRPFAAGDPCNPSDDYARSKYSAEQLLFAIARKMGMEVIVIRAPLIYGPGVRANFLKLLSWVYRGVPLPLGCVKNRRSLVSVWNLCDLVRTIIGLPKIASGVLMVSDGFDLSTPELVEYLAGSMNRSPRLVRVPVPILKFAAALAGKSAEVSRLCGSLAVDISDVKQQLCWTPPLSIEEGMSQTAKWYMKMLLEQHE
jgi:nucleoside-diphosphate-sugar epimerase